MNLFRSSSSSRFNPRPAAGIATGLALVAAGLILQFKGDYRYTPFVLALVGAGFYTLLRVWISHRPLPTLTPDQPSFQVSLPNGGFQVFHRFVLPLFPLVFLVLLCAMDALGEMTEDDKGLLLKFLGFAIPLLAVIMIVAVRTRRLYYRRIALSLIGDEEALWVRGPFSWISWKIADLRVRRVLCPDGIRLAALEIAGDEEDDFFVIPVPAAMESQGAFLEHTAAWLARRNVPVVIQQQVVPVPGWRQFVLVLLVVFLWIIVLMHGTSALVASGFFWIHWMLCGIPNPTTFVLWKSYGLLAGVAVLLTPMRIWMEKLVSGKWWRRNPRQLEVWALDGGIDRRAALGGSGRVVLKTDGPAILLKAGKHQHRILPSQVTHLERRNVNPKLKNRLLERYFGRLIFLSWSGEDGHQRSVFLKVVDGLVSGRYRRREKRLFEALENWWREGKEPDLSMPAIQPKRLGPLLAAAFMAVCLLAYGLHDYLVGRYVRTGRLIPLARIQPAFPPYPEWYLYAVEAVPSGPLLGGISQNTRFESWVYDPQAQRWRYPKAMMPTNATLSQPGGVTHVLQHNYFPLSMMQLAYSRRHGETDWPPQIISLQTGQGRDLTSLPSANVAALYKDEKVFYAVLLENTPVKVLGSVTARITYDIGWVDARRDVRHSLGQLVIERPTIGSFSSYISSCDAVFFPGGRFVLFGQTIVDLETGSQQEVVFSAADKIGYLRFRANDIFPMGNRLRIRITQSTWPNTLVKVLEVDSVSARVEIIDQLPPDVNLLSADGDRWLLAHFVPSPGQPPPPPVRLAAGPSLPGPIPGKTIYALYHHDSRTSQTLFEEPNAPGLSYHLMAGRPELFAWSPKDGISIEPIEMKQSKKPPN